MLKKCAVLNHAAKEFLIALDSLPVLCCHEELTSCSRRQQIIVSLEIVG